MRAGTLDHMCALQSMPRIESRATCMGLLSAPPISRDDAALLLCCDTQGACPLEEIALCGGSCRMQPATKYFCDAPVKVPGLTRGSSINCVGRERVMCGSWLRSNEHGYLTYPAPLTVVKR